MPPITTHDEQDKPSIPKERRFKLSRACDRCRRRRIKCDEGHPCQSCLAANSACTFEEPGKRSHPHKSKRASTLEDRMHHLESLIQAIPFNLFGGTSNGAGGIPISPTVGNDPSGSNGVHTPFATSPHLYPLGVPPPSLTTFPLINPSTHFPSSSGGRRSSMSSTAGPTCFSANHLAEETARLSIAPSYLYLDDEGYTRWQGETSGLPLLDLLVDRVAQAPPTVKREGGTFFPSRDCWSTKNGQLTTEDWFPDRQPRRTTTVNPETLWKLITSFIVPDLMDSLVQCFLSTSYYLMPFLHVPTFLADYGNPQKWGEPGFASFIVSICCLSSRHIDDPRVRADPSDGFSAGVQWFDLFAKLRTLPTADRPTLYTVQSVFVAAVYAVGLGKLSRAFALLSEAITLSIDCGLHRSAEQYDCFDPVEDEVRKRTFWCVYMWDKQAGAAFGRPAMFRLRDCDVPEPAQVDDEFITKEGIGLQPSGVESRLGAFVATLRLFVVLESVLDVPLSYNAISQSFLARASSMMAGYKRSASDALRDEETLLDELVRALPAYWTHSPETMSSENVIRVTQSERLHCLEQFIRMLIQRHRFSAFLAERTYGGGGGGAEGGEQGDAERDAMMACHACAIELVQSHMQVATKGLMTYYGVHVIHQLAQAGRSLIAVLLNCRTEDLQPLVSPSLEALRNCVGLLRRFSGRYICGLRSGDLIEEFCRLTHIPLDTPAPVRLETPQSLPPWVRPVRKKANSTGRSPAGSTDSNGSPEASSPQMIMDHVFDLNTGGVSANGGPNSTTPTLTGASATGPQTPSLSGVNGAFSSNGTMKGDSSGTSASSASGPSSSFSLDPSSIGGGGVNGFGSIGGGMYDMDGLIGMHHSQLQGINQHDGTGLSPSTLMSMLNDGNFDMSALFAADSPLMFDMSGGGGNGGQQSQQQNQSQSQHSPVGQQQHPNVVQNPLLGIGGYGSGSLKSDGMFGSLVTSP